MGRAVGNPPPARLAPRAPPPARPPVGGLHTGTRGPESPGQSTQPARPCPAPRARTASRRSRAGPRSPAAGRGTTGRRPPASSGTSAGTARPRRWNGARRPAARAGWCRGCARSGAGRPAARHTPEPRRWGGCRREPAAWMPARAALRGQRASAEAAPRRAAAPATRRGRPAHRHLAGCRRTGRQRGQQKTRDEARGRI